MNFCRVYWQQVILFPLGPYGKSKNFVTIGVVLGVVYFYSSFVSET